MTQINTDFIRTADHLAALAYFEGYDCPPLRALNRWIRDETSGLGAASPGAAARSSTVGTIVAPATRPLARRGRPSTQTARGTATGAANVSDMPVAAGPYYYAASGYTGLLSAEEDRILSYLNANPGATRQQIAAALGKAQNVIGINLGSSRRSLVTKGAVTRTATPLAATGEAASKAA